MAEQGPSLAERLAPLPPGQNALGDRVRETIGAAIVDGRLAAGERLNDKDLADALGVSRTPVREALQKLSWAGLIEMSPNRYTRVTQVSDEVVSSTLEYTGFQAGVVLQLATYRMSDDALAESIMMLDEMIRASDRDDGAALMLASRDFVKHLTQHCGNSVLVAVMREAGLLVARNLREARPMLGSSEFRGRTYRKMRTAMTMRDGESAGRLFRLQHGIGMDDEGVAH